MSNVQGKDDSGANDVLSWQMVFETHRASGLTIKQFCENERLAQWRFFYWRKRLQKASNPLSSHKIIDINRESGKANSSDFHKVAEVLPSPTELRIEFPGGILLHIPDCHDQVLLRHVIDVLRELAC